MSENGTEEISLMDLDEKLTEMKKLKASLGREVNQNQMEALNLRSDLKALYSKHEDLKAQIVLSEGTLLKRREEINSIDEFLGKKGKLLEAEKRDLVALRENIYAENAVFQDEKKRMKEELEEARKQLSRHELNLLNRDNDLKVGEKYLSGELEAMNLRQTKLKEDELKIQIKSQEADKMKEEAALLKSQAQRELEEAKASIVSYESKASEIAQKEKSFTEKEAHIRTCYNEITIKTKEIEEADKDLIIEDNRLRDIRTRLYKEIEICKIDARKKKEFQKEIENEENVK